MSTKYQEVMSQADLSRNKALDDLFKDMPDETDVIVALPSKGKFYKTKSPIVVKPLTFEDEQKILSGKNKKDNIINQIIAKCVEGIDTNELLTMDKLYLLMKIREVSYGPIYSFEIGCPSCGQITNVALNISEHLSVNDIPEELTDPREIMLPVLKKVAVVRFPRSYDEIYLGDVEVAVKNLYRFVESIDGNTDPVLISQALKRMHIRDLKTISNEVNRNDLGLDPRFMFECPHCSYNTMLAVPLDANFFSVS